MVRAVILIAGSEVGCLYWYYINPRTWNTKAFIWSDSDR